MSQQPDHGKTIAFTPSSASELQRRLHGVVGGGASASSSAGQLSWSSQALSSTGGPLSSQPLKPRMNTKGLRQSKSKPSFCSTLPASMLLGSSASASALHTLEVSLCVLLGLGCNTAFHFCREKVPEKTPATKLLEANPFCHPSMVHAVLLQPRRPLGPAQC